MNDSTINRRQVLSATGAVIVGGLITTGSVTADEHDNPQMFSTDLSGDAEVPSVETNASGHATFELSADGSELHFEVYIDCIRNVNQGHIHLGGPDENGPVVVWLYPQETQEPETIEGLQRDFVLAEGTVTEADLVDELEGESLDALAAEMEAGQTYVNIHSEQNPEGEIRGQIEADEDIDRGEPVEDSEEPEEEESEEEPEEEDPEEEEDDDDLAAPDANFSLGEINVGASVEPEDEFVTIVNEGEEVDLNGFVLRDGPGGVVDAGTVTAFTFPSHTFGEGESVTVYTDDNPDADFSWGIGRPIWNQEGDTVIVDDPDGNTVMEETYESQVSAIQFVVGQVRALFA